jgi:hypothetical protein
MRRLCATLHIHGSQTQRGEHDVRR